MITKSLFCVLINDGVVCNQSEGKERKGKEWKGMEGIITNSGNGYGSKGYIS